MQVGQQRIAPLLFVLTLILALGVSGCELRAVGESEQIANVETILAGTPSATPSPTITQTPTVTETGTPTQGPSPTPSDTPTPSNTPLPPTPTPNPNLIGFSYCDQRAGLGIGRYSTTLQEIRVSGSPASERIELRFELGAGSAPIHARATCIEAGEDSFLLRVDLPGWLRDERFSASPLSPTISLDGARTIADAGFRIDPDAPTGATLEIELDAALPFRLQVERNPSRVIIDVARTASLVGGSDPLRVATGGGDPQLAAPVFMSYDGEIWRIDQQSSSDDATGLRADGAAATNLSNSIESETDLAVSPDGSMIAFCRAAPGLDPADAGLAVPSTLWLMDADGDNQRPLPQSGVSCADPSFSLDGSRIAFAVDETGAIPTQRTIYTVATTGGQPQRLIEAFDEWSRFAPQWLADDTIVFAANTQDGRSTLFLQRADGIVIDIGAELLVGDDLRARYQSLGRPLAAPDGERFAVEALRADAPGAELLILAADGSLVEIIGTQRIVPPAPTPTPSTTPTPTRTPRPSATPATPEPTATEVAEPSATPTVTATPEPEPGIDPDPVREGPYWTRPLGWNNDGRLYYISTNCTSLLAHDYELSRWSGPQRSELLATGQSLASLGLSAVTGNGLVYTSIEAASADPRGPADRAPRSAAEIWLWDFDSGARGLLIGTERGLTALAP
jgi:outer membrane biosynthesis protein TonB